MRHYRSLITYCSTLFILIYLPSLSPSSALANKKILSPYHAHPVNPFISRTMQMAGQFFYKHIKPTEIKIKGQQNIPKGKPIIFAPTHPGRAAGQIMFLALGKTMRPENIRILTAANEMGIGIKVKNPIKRLMLKIRGYLMRKVGCFPVNTRKFDRTSIIKTQSFITDAMNNNNGIVIFPTGRAAWKGDNPTEKLQAGVAKFALHTAKKRQKTLAAQNAFPYIIPVYIHMTPEYLENPALDRAQLRQLPKGKHRTAVVEYGRPLARDYLEKKLADKLILHDLKAELTRLQSLAASSSN